MSRFQTAVTGLFLLGQWLLPHNELDGRGLQPRSAPADDTALGNLSRRGDAPNGSANRADTDRDTREPASLTAHTDRPAATGRLAGFGSRGSTPSSSPQQSRARRPRVAVRRRRLSTDGRSRRTRSSGYL